MALLVRHSLQGSWEILCQCFLYVLCPQRVATPADIKDDNLLGIPLHFLIETRDWWTVGLKGQRDQFAEAHLSAPALFTHHLGSERRASQGLSCSHNTAMSHTGQRRRKRRGGELTVVCAQLPPCPPQRPFPIHRLLFLQGLQSKPNKCRKSLGVERAFSLEIVRFSALMLQI